MTKELSQKLATVRDGDFVGRLYDDKDEWLGFFRGWWMIDKKMKPYIRFNIPIPGGRTYGVSLRPTSVLSHPDPKVIERVLAREAGMVAADLELLGIEDE